MEGYKKTPKNPNYFCCEICDFNTSNKKDYNRHLLRPKHLENEKRYKMIQNDIYLPKKTPHEDYMCDCGRAYKYSSGLWRHKKYCQPNSVVNNNTINTKTVITPELIIEIIKQNKELQQTLIEQNKTIIDLTQKTGTHNSYNNNKTFNLQLFLNDTCKDAINLTDFVNQIQVSISDLEETGKIGYAEGISKVFIKNLNGIDLKKRPIHCSDSKRETLYIKNENIWSKDDENKTNLTKAIKHVANKNIKKIIEWQQVNPEYSDPDSKKNDKYMQIVLNSMSGSTKEESDKNYEKIVKNIVKETIIQKEN
jgi:hypothetical protein